MIIACPACATRYVVPDSAIGVEGRTVRCAKCRHSWFQDGPEVAAVPKAAPAPAAAEPAPAPRAAPEPAPPPQVTAPPAPVAQPEPDARPGFSAFEAEEAPPPPAPVRVQPEPAPQPEAEQKEEEIAPPEAFSGEHFPSPPPTDEYDEPDPEEIYSHFDPQPPFRPRRNILRLWTYAAAIFALFAVGSVIAVSYWGLPDWVPIRQPTFGLGQSDLVLDFPPAKQDRRQLPNGTEYFEANGTVTNVGTKTRTLPPILIVLRDSKDRIVYDWEIVPSKRSLAPGESVTIDEALLDVPKAAKFAEIGWKPG